MGKSDSLLNEGLEFYTKLFKSSEGIWSLGTVIGDRRIKVEVQNQDVGDIPTYNVIVGDLSNNDLILLFNFLSKALALSVEDPSADDVVEDLPKVEEPKIVEQVAPEVLSDLAFSDDVSGADLSSLCAPSSNIDTPEIEPEAEDDSIEDVFKDLDAPKTLSDIIQDKSGNDNHGVVENQPSLPNVEVVHVEMDDTEIDEEGITAKDLENAKTLTGIFNLFLRAGYGFEDEEDVVEALSQAQKECNCKPLKGRRKSGLRKEWGEYWRSKRKTKGGTLV